MKIFYQFITVLMIFIAALFTYIYVNILANIFREKRRDDSLVWLLTRSGKVFFIITGILYLVLCLFTISFTLYGFQHKVYHIACSAMVVLAIYSMLITSQANSIALCGKRNMVIGRMIFDYRKMKKVELNPHHILTFVYAQKAYTYSTRWLDVALLRRAIYRRM